VHRGYGAAMLQIRLETLRKASVAAHAAFPVRIASPNDVPQLFLIARQRLMT